MLNGKYDRGFAFLGLDPGSAYVYDAAGHAYLSAGDVEAALESWSHLPDENTFVWERETVRKCQTGPLTADDVESVRRSMKAVTDGEIYYFTGQVLIHCGALDAGFEMVRSAIDRNYCAATGLASEPFWDPHREDPRFQEALRAANECRDRFLKRSG